MIRALFFDMGNVLFYFSHERMCRQIGELVRRSCEEVRSVLVDSGLFNRYESGMFSTTELRRKLESTFEQSIDSASFLRAAGDIFSANESIESLIEQLASSGYPLVLLSNTCDAHIRWVSERFPVLRHFRQRALSFELRAAKPEPEIFYAAAQMVGIPPTECFFTDDTPGHVEGARRVGIDAILYRDTEQLITGLRERGIDVT